MENNDVLRRIRYTFNLSDSQMIKLFETGNKEVTRAEISSWMKREGDEDFSELEDHALASFLNGFIISKRGKQEGKEPIAETKLTNNIIFRKLKIALNLKSEDIVELFKLADKQISISEIGSFLRNKQHNKYRDFNGQYMRNFMNGLQAKFHKEEE